MPAIASSAHQQSSVTYWLPLVFLPALAMDSTPGASRPDSPVYAVTQACTHTCCCLSCPSFASRNTNGTNHSQQCTSTKLSDLLAAVGVLAGIGHGQHARRMQHIESLVCKFPAVD